MLEDRRLSPQEEIIIPSSKCKVLSGRFHGTWGHGSPVLYRYLYSTVLDEVTLTCVASVELANLIDAGDGTHNDNHHTHSTPATDAAHSRSLVTPILSRFMRDPHMTGRVSTTQSQSNGPAAVVCADRH